MTNPKLIKALKIAIDIQTLIENKIDLETKDLKRSHPWKGSLGSVSVLSEIFDLFLLLPLTNIPEEEVLRWLKTVQIDTCFRNFVPINKDLKNLILQQTIHVIISSDYNVINQTKDIARSYFLQKKIDEQHIQDGIYRVDSWKEIVRDISLYSF